VTHIKALSMCGWIRKASPLLVPRGNNGGGVGQGQPADVAPHHLAGAKGVLRESVSATWKRAADASPDLGAETDIVLMLIVGAAERTLFEQGVIRMRCDAI
jgi:hypothetical protein